MIRDQSGTEETIVDSKKAGEVTYGELVAESQVLLSIALSDLDGVVDILDSHGIVGDVPHATGATSALEVSGQSRGHTGPDLDASTVLHCIRSLQQCGKTRHSFPWRLTDALNMEML